MPERGKITFPRSFARRFARPATSVFSFVPSNASGCTRARACTSTACCAIATCAHRNRAPIYVWTRGWKLRFPSSKDCRNPPLPPLRNDYRVSICSGVAYRLQGEKRGFREADDVLCLLRLDGILYANVENLRIVIPRHNEPVVSARAIARADKVYVNGNRNSFARDKWYHEDLRVILSDSF